jgi:hypothetical protein
LMRDEGQPAGEGLAEDRSRNPDINTFICIFS